jgi:hypothetical protein
MKRHSKTSDAHDITGARPTTSNCAQKRRRRATKRAKQQPADQAQALFDDAVAEARRLRRKHRAYYELDPKRFRSTVSKAHCCIYRLKPGPKTDQRIVNAARDRARGAEWPTLYPLYIEHYSDMPVFTRALAEDGFQRKVNAYLKRHQRLRRKWRKKTGDQR